MIWVFCRRTRSSITSFSILQPPNPHRGGYDLPQRQRLARTRSEDTKPRLLGHWGTCPRLILAHVHLNMFIKKGNEKMISVVGLGMSLPLHCMPLFTLLIPLPGHGAPAILATLWIEGSLTKFFPQYSFDKSGLKNLSPGISTPAVFPPISTLRFRGQLMEENSDILLPLLSVPSWISRS